MPPPCCCSPQWVGAPCGSHGPYVFYRAFRFQRRGGGRARVLSLGDFFFVRCRAEEPACIAELQLLWEERTSRQLLSSAKLYFLPEDTPQGRTSDHGEVGTAAPAPAHLRAGLRAGRRDGTGRDGGRWRAGGAVPGAARVREVGGRAAVTHRAVLAPRDGSLRGGAGAPGARLCALVRANAAGAARRMPPGSGRVAPAPLSPVRTVSHSVRGTGRTRVPRSRCRAGRGEGRNFARRCPGSAPSSASRALRRGRAGPGGGNRAPREPPRAPRPCVQGRPLPAV